MIENLIRFGVLLVFALFMTLLNLKSSRSPIVKSLSFWLLLAATGGAMYFGLLVVLA